MIYRQCAALLRHNQSSFQAILIALALTALSACDGTSVIDVSIAGDSPGVASVVVTDVIDDEATVDWNLTSGAFAEQWNLYQNNLRVCSGTPLTVAASDDSPSYQTGGCTIALQEGSNSFQVQLCNADSSQCSSSATEVIDYQEPTELGAIAWQDLPGSETTESQHYLSWSKGEGLNGDYWHIYQDDAVACSGTLSYSAALGAQSAGCDVTLDLGANSFQAQLCQTQPVGIDDNCVQSSLVSLTFSTDPERILATPIIEELDESLPANYDTTISWSKDTSSGSAGEDWNLSNHGAVICQGVLADGANGASCSVQLVEGSNNLQVRLCTAVETYSGASCDYSATVAVDGFDPEPLTPGTITITDSLPAQVSDAPSVVVDWQIASGNGVRSWSVFGNDDLYCDTANADEYYWSGSCPIALESGTNTISVTGCNYGYADSESCTTSSEVEVEYITVPGTPELTTSLPATTYLSEHNLSWELTEGEAADYWLAMVNDISQCSDDLAQLTPQSGSCIVELDSGVNLIAVRLCVANESGSAYCSDSETEQVELLAPVPSQPAITTPEQSIADDIILLEWSKSGGDNGSYWSLSNNGALVAACADQPLLSIGSSQSGYCNLPLELGANLISVSLCNDNAAGTTSCSTSESITITRESAAPEFTSGTSASVAENTSTVFYTATVTDNDSSQEQLSFALSGADSSWFSIDSSGGLAFVSAADYEAPQDANGDNTYQLSLRVTDETELYDQLELSISVSNVNDAAPEFTSAAAVSVAENSSGVVHTIQASDAEGDTISYSLAGTDADSFSLDSSSGALSFFSPPNYEDAQDHDQDNTYELSIIATDGSNSTSQDIAIAVKDSNEAPSFSTSSVSLTTAENNASFVYAVEAASDEDSGQQLSYQLTGTDQSAFSLDASTLKLSFRAPPNYEAPSDQDTNNDYQISISASDGEYATSQDIVISVTNLNDEAPQFTSVTSLALAYADVTLGATIYTAASIDADANDATSYALSGAQAISFSLDPSSGELAFSQLPAQEDLPQDGGITYDLIITATDLGGNSTDLGLSINLLEIIGSAPEFAQASVSLSVAENTTASLHQAAATDADGDTIAYSLTGIDSSLFTIDSGSGELGFNSPPDYEQPLDSDLDNTYDLTITATDPIGNQAQQSLTVTIDNLNDNSPQFDLTADSFAIAENTSAVTTITASDADNDTLTLSLVVFDDSSFFSLDSSSGALAFTSAPDFETAQDSNSDNTYEIELSVSDGSHTTTASISVTVTNVDEAPSFAADNQSLSVNENTSGSLYTAAASDPEQANLTYSASGTDASLFTIGSSSGELSFKSIPDFEIPLDQGADNTYQLDITASDGGNSVSQALSITVANVNEPHSFAATSVSLDTSENNSSFTYTVEAASDPDSGSALTYQLTGDDQAAFNFDPDTRKLSFKTKPDYETPADQNSDNLYQVDITATDSDYSASQSITISVSDLNDEAPQFTSLGSQAVNYSTVQVGDIVYTATSTDLDAGDQVSYALSGADASSFTFDASGGALAFAQLPSLTEFQSSNGGIAYALTITATDLAGNSSVLDLTVNLVDDTGSAPVFAQASANITVDENVVGIIYQAAASDADGDPIAYSLAGADAVVFTIDPSSGELSFQAPPDYEQPLDSDLDNTYELTIVATDPVGNQGSQSLAIAITNLNDNSPQLDLTANSFTIAENTSAVTTITASDADNDTLTLALVVSDDSSFFSLDSSSGALAFTSAPDFETAQDSNSDNTYEIELSVSDGSHTTSASISVTVTNVDEAPSFAADNQSLSVNENTSGSLYTAAASDPEQANLTYSASGTDASLFTIGSSSGELSFKSIPDFEIPLDQGADNTYQLDITASDGGNSVSQALSITVANVNEPHSFAATSVSLDTSENNSSFTYTVEAASDPDSGSALTYQLTGDDQAAFNFDPDTRKLSFKTKPDYETPADQNSDNLYQVDITATDSDYSASQSITISVSDLNDEAPQFTSLGSQAVNYSTVQVGDIVYTATSTDLDAGDQVSYALSGADASSFTFDASGGALAFAQLPSLTEFQSSNGGIAYALTITATDLAGNSSVLDLTVNLVDDTGSAPVFAQASANITVDENVVGIIYQAAASDADGDPIAYSLAGADAVVFTIDPSSGELSFQAPPDYEQPLDSDLDNTYELTIVATDPVGNQGSQSLAIAITNLNDNSPQFDLTAYSFAIAENTSAVTTITASDADNDTLTLSLVVADDSSFFSLDSSSGALAFTSAPDFETAQDSNSDNTYDLELSVSDGSSTTTASISVTVTNVDEAPSFATDSQSVSISENASGSVYTATASDPEQANLIYSASGTDASLFTIGSSSGELSFKSIPDFEAPLDQGADNIYQLDITASDASNSVSQALSITVANVNEPHSFASTSVSLGTSENNSSFTYTVEAASDPDSGSALTYQLTGDDQAAFNFDPDTRELSFKTNPDYESPVDQDNDNTYQISISAFDADHSASQNISISVSDLNDEAPQFTSLGSQAVNYSTVQVGDIVYTATSTDLDAGDQVSYALSGADASHFTFDASSGALAFAQLPSLSEFQSSNGGIAYALTITATDLANNSSVLGLTINLVDDTGSAPVFAQDSTSIDVDENSAGSVYTAQATDADPGDTLAYSISGSDAALFTIDPSSGELAFNTAPDYEQPLDSDLDNTYELTIVATDPVGNQGSQSLAIAITNLNDNSPQFDLTAYSFAIAENTSAVTTITASDADNDTLTLSLVVADDSSFFSLDSSSGALAFTSAPDFETAQDSNSDNTYDLELSVSDGSSTTTASISVTVTNVDEAPSFATDSQSVSISENASGSVYTATASDPEQANLIYSASGTDASLFTIGSSSGELSFKSIPDFEAPLDQGADNIYQLDITASDASNSVSQALSITVANVNEPHSFASTSVSLGTSENNSSFTYTVEAASDPDSGSALTYQLTGDDQAAFNFDPDTRELSFKTNPDYESPVDQDNDNTYQISISAFDADHSASQNISISVSDLNDEAPQFTSLGSQAVNYSTVQVGDIVYTATSTDLDAGDQVSYALSGADASHFTFDASSGALAFAQLPSLSEFQSSNGGIAYALTITATDLANNSSVLGLTINLVDDTGSAPVFAQDSTSIDVDENSAGSVYTAQATDADPGDTLAYSISGSDAALFTIDSSSGDLAFNAAPDFENPSDDGQDNTYDLTITATDAIGKQASQSLALTVTNVNEASSFAATSVNLNADENDLSFTHIVDAADDPDQGETLTYQLAGDDQSAFNFDPDTRALSFQQAPDFESPADQDLDNAYQIDITATDADYSTTQAITITVANVEESPYFHSTTDHVEIAEDPATEGTASPVLALTIQAADDEDDLAGTSLNFVISGGADSDKFSLTAVDANSADLSFSISPDFDNPHDANLDSNYSLSIQVADSSGASEQHDLIVQVLGINDEVPQLTSAASADVNENSTAVFYTATATDADRSDWSDSDPSKRYQPNLDSITFSLDSANYPDSSFFSIDASSGELQATSGLNYENPQSSAQSNSYSVAIELADSAANSSVDIITVTVIDDPNEPEPIDYAAPQIPWFYSDVNVGESIDIPWIIYSGDGAIAWSLLVNGATVCSESASISDPVTSGVCSVSSSHLTSGSALNATAVSVTYSDSSSQLSEEVTFAYAASSAINFPAPSSNQDATACAGVDIGDPVNATSNSACYDYLLGDDDFGGPHDQVPSYLDPANGRDFEVIAYFIEWGIYSRDFHPADLPANLLSTALFSFVKLKDDNSSDPNCETCSFTGEVDLADGWAALSKSYATDAWCDINYDDWTVDSACKGNGIFKQFWLLKQKFPHLKTCVSVGGWSFSRPFPLVGESATMRAIFADSIVDMAEKYHFDCIDIDWEFPIIGGGDYKVTDASGNPSYDYDLDGDTPFLAPSDNDAQYFANLIQELRSEIDSRGLAIDINSAMYAGDYGMSKMDYNLFAGNLHGIHMMTYDFYGAWDPYTGMQAALFPNSDPLSNEVALQYPTAYNNQHNIASAMARAVNNAIDNGFESNAKMRRKIVPGLAFYGRNYSGVSTTPVPGAYMVLANSPAEQLSWEQGNLNYVQLKGYYDHGETLHGNGDYDGGGYNTGGRSWTYNWDDESQTPFLYDSATQSFVSYTDPRGIFYQTCHAARENSKGVMFWEISGDSEDSQLVNAIHAALRGDTLSQYSNQPHCADIIGYGAASSDDDDS